jgi:ABC-type polysaccharide/polyol phosphate export permease
METTAVLDRPAPAATDADIESPPQSSLVGQYREIGHELWAHRELLVQLTLRDVRLRYKQAVMGFGWALLMPIFVVMSGLVVRYAMAYYSGAAVNGSEISGMMVKAVVWAFFAGAVGFATASLVTNMVLVTKVYFAREVLPLSATMAQAFDSAVGAAAVAVLLAVLGVRPTWALLWVPVLALLLFCFTAAVALFLSCANLFYRDVKYIVQIVLTFGIFFTPVLFEPVMFGPRGARLLMLNPLSPFLEGLRLSVVHGHNLMTPLVELSRKGEAVLVWTPWYLGYATLWAVAGLALASLMFHKLEFVFAEYI